MNAAPLTEQLDRLVWSLWRRGRLGRRLPGFWASASSYATPDCRFSACNRLYRSASLRSVQMGRMSYVAEATRIGFARIGAFCSIGPQVLLGGLGWHPTDRLSTHPAWYSARRQAGMSYVEHDRLAELPDTTVGNDVWIGARSVVLDGVVIGDGAIIAAGAIVTRAVPAYAICAGVPARTLRLRFDENVIAALQDWQWWNLADEQLRGLCDAFFSQRHWTVAHIEALRRGNNHSSGVPDQTP